MQHNAVFYYAIRDMLKIGDIILFHGILLSSKINEFFIRNQWFNAWMLIRPKDFSSVATLPLIRIGQLFGGSFIYV